MALVEDGYSCDNMQCGYITFSKTIKDTTWFIGVEVFCDTISMERDVLELEEFEIMEDTTEIEDLETFRFGKKGFEEEVRKNPYFPWQLDDLEDCEIEFIPSGCRIVSSSITFDQLERLVQSKGLKIEVINPHDSIDFGWYFKVTDRDDKQVSSGSFLRCLDYPLDSNLWSAEFSNSNIFNDTH